jgi:peptidase E
VAASIHLIGGGPGTVRALRRHYREALAELPTARPTVAYVGVASNDNRAFYAMIRAGLALGGARMVLAKIASPRAPASEAKSVLEACDMVFVSGGDVEHGMRVLHEKDMAAPLRALAKAGKPMFGISAGSLMLAREWVRFPDDDEARAEIFGCLGIAPVHVDAHSEDDGWSELRVLVRLLHERGDREAVGYGLTRGGGLRLKVGPAGTTCDAIGTPAPALVVRRGKVVEGKPLPLVEATPRGAPTKRASRGSQPPGRRAPRP